MVAGFALAAPAEAAEGSYVLKRIKERGVVNMGHREASVPFSYIGSDGKHPNDSGQQKIANLFAAQVF